MSHHLRRRSDPGAADYSRERNGKNALTRALGNQVLRLLVPALVAGGASYVAVATQLVRLEERLNSIRAEMQLSQDFLQREIAGLHVVDERLAKEIEIVRVRRREERQE